MSDMAVWKRVRRSDRTVAPFAGAVSALVGVVLLGLAIGVIGDPATREEENAAQELALRIFGCWLLGGAALYAVLGMFRALLGHLAALLIGPLAVIVALLVLTV
ncbi:hypothetical protein HTV80_18040 [Streptomyces sp. Vc74B-19]|uniref:hypothetical protein n=1 Tax=unclassified Streptomyces TaxID=2593676 RepID=UPI001BFC006E|nr:MULTISPECIES: hypothetical protein [unclassified Streptomyces]MBT3164997.1 hypothetical protein [Streptomyces sp. Vc74B-19]MCO4694608.1 hypothetical protein [Streptomyces sp. RO-S4]MDU0302943.1 hypothetical protein [Streptomyces sp. PAL114]